MCLEAMKQGQNFWATVQRHRHNAQTMVFYITCMLPQLANFYSCYKFFVSKLWNKLNKEILGLFKISDIYRHFVWKPALIGNSLFIIGYFAIVIVIYFEESSFISTFWRLHINGPAVFFMNIKVCSGAARWTFINPSILMCESFVMVISYCVNNMSAKKMESGVFIL